MFKKLLATAALLCSIPALASADWNLKTQALTAGGTITVGTTVGGVTTGVKQSVTNGPVFNTYTSNARSVGVEVVPNPGYQISSVSRGGSSTSAAFTSSLYQGVFTGTEGSLETLAVTFVRVANAYINVTAEDATPGGHVTPTVIPNVFEGTMVSTPMTFRCVPEKDYKVSSVLVTGVSAYTAGSGGYVLTPSVAAAQVSQSVNVAIVAGTQLTSDVNVECSYFTTAVVADAGAPQTVLLANATNVPLTGSSTNGTFSQWTVVKTPSATATATITGATSANATVTMNEVGVYQFEYAAGGGSRGTSYTTINVVNKFSEGAAQCITCHKENLGTAATTTLYNNYSTSVHNLNKVFCASCHVGADKGAHPGTPTCSTASACHPTITAVPNMANSVGATACAPCHSTNDVHSFSKTGSLVAAGSANCLGCHAVAAPAHRTGSDGVREVVSEFTRNSHHISTGALTNAQCVVCHAAGTASGATIVLDNTKHMQGGVIYLRNANVTLTANSTAATFSWNPASPNHTTMDQFCLSCHNSGGAPTAFAALGAAAPAGSSASNPFGTNMTNSYDTMLRPAVVNVFDQFATTNVAHHAVRGKKYTTRTRPTTSAKSVFTQYSGAATFAPAGKQGAAYNAYSTQTEGKITLAASGLGQLSPGSRKTIYEAGLFVDAYVPLGATLPVADDSTLHCGDCHTVGQYKVGSSVNEFGEPTAQVIGAHGSENEYMLRTSTGVDELHHQSNNNGANAGPVDGTYVCFLCHKQTEEETGGYNAMGFHGGMEGANTSYCNGRAAESVGLTGFGGTFINTGVNGIKVGTGQTRVPNIIGTNAGGNLFGYSCAHCHNAGQNNTFGGIHGGNATYKSYSAMGVLASRVSGGTTIAAVSRKPVRFMGGLSLKYNGGGNASKWEAGTLQRANREGCYNQSTVTTTTPGNLRGKLWGADAPTLGVGTDDAVGAQPASNATTTWGSCSHHNGGMTTGAGTGPTRVGVQRPLSY